MKKNSPLILKLRYADFKKVRQRRAYEIKRCRLRPLCGINFIISRMREPHEDWSGVVAGQFLTEEQAQAVKVACMAHAVWDVSVKRYLWHESKIAKLFK